MTRDHMLEALRERMKSLPFNNLVGITVDQVHEDGVTVSCPFREELMNMHRTVHGGVTATLADVAGGFSTMSRYGADRLATTVDLKLNYLSPIKGPRIVARGRVLKAGKTLCVIQAEIGDGESVGAVAVVTYMLLPARGQASLRPA